MRLLVMRKESIATSVTASATLCTVHMYLISESLNKVNLSVLQWSVPPQEVSFSAKVPAKKPQEKLHRN